MKVLQNLLTDPSRPPAAKKSHKNVLLKYVFAFEFIFGEWLSKYFISSWRQSKSYSKLVDAAFANNLTKYYE
jgi:hypothetical protein